MEEKQLNQRLHEMFMEVVLVIASIKQGFLAENQTTLTEGETKLMRMLISNLPFTEELGKKETKNEVEKKYLTLLPHLQLMAVILRNLINENKKRIESNIPFTDKAISEMNELYILMHTQFEDTAHYILTRNSHLRMHIRTGMEKLLKRADEYGTEHESRLITGICIPKASYVYNAIINCIKGLSWELTIFSEKL